MNVDFLVIAPVFFVVILGFISRNAGIVDKDFGKKLLQFAIAIPIAATAFLSISSLKPSHNDFLLPVLGFSFVLFMYFSSRLISRKFSLPKSQEGVFRISLMILNTAFVLIFAIPLLGDAGVQKVFLIDLGSAPLIFSLVYYVAAKNSPTSKASKSEIIRKVALFPPFLAAVAGLLVVLFSLSVPGIVTSLLSPVSAMSFPLLAFSTGIFLEPKFVNPKVIASSILIKMGFGLALALALSSVFGITGISKAVLLAVFASPVGFNTVAFSAKENLDVELAASIFFTSAFIGLFSVPFLLASGL